MDLRIHIWLENEKGIYLGQGIIMLLIRIEKLGSLRKAALDLKMSYRAAWGKIKNAEMQLGMPLVQKETQNKNLFQLSNFGKEIIKKFLDLYQDVENYALTKSQIQFPNLVIAKGKSSLI